MRPGVRVFVGADRASDRAAFSRVPNNLWIADHERSGVTSNNFAGDGVPPVIRSLFCAELLFAAMNHHRCYVEPALPLNVEISMLPAGWSVVVTVVAFAGVVLASSPQPETGFKPQL